MRTLFLLAFVLGLVIVVAAPAGRADAKGNGNWVLTGGELGDYAMNVTLDLVERPVGTQVDPPASVPATHYDLMGSSGNFAIAYQLVHGPWVRYYRLEPLSGEHVSLNELYTSATADDGTMQISGSLSEEFVTHALVDTVSRPPVGSALDPPAYQISYAGYIRPGAGIGGLLGFYAPPGDGQNGRFWDDGFAPDKSTPYYETTAEFDAIMSAALHRDGAETAATKRQASGGVGHDGPATIAVALGLGLVVVLGALNLASRRRFR